MNINFWLVRAFIEIHSILSTTVRVSFELHALEKKIELFIKCSRSHLTLRTKH